MVPGQAAAPGQAQSEPRARDTVSTHCSGVTCPVAEAGHRTSNPGQQVELQRGVQLFSHLPTSWAQASDWERADAIRCNPATPSKKGGEKQPPRHRKRRGGGEGRKDNHSPRQANCLFPPSLEPGATGRQTPKNRDQVLPAQGTAGQGVLQHPLGPPGDGVPQDPQQAGRRAEPP